MNYEYIAQVISWILIIGVILYASYVLLREPAIESDKCD